MIQTVTEHIFINDMQAIRPDNFSYEGLQELFSYLDEIEPEDSEVEFDPIGICCDFSQCSLKEFLDSYDVEIEEGASDEDIKEAISSYIGYNGFWHTFINFDSEIVFENF
jgi:hypothetical protein